MGNALTDLFAQVQSDAAKLNISDEDDFMSYSSRGETDFVPEILPAEITLRGYQVAAVETILKFRRGILGFAPGMGKTPTALTAIANLGGKTVVVIPPSLAYDPWKKETARLFPNLKVKILRGQTPTLGGISDNVDIVICGDSIVQHRAKEIIEWGPDNLIVDEAQRHKNFKAKRAKATEEISSFVRENDGVVILMTGTIATNNAEEVWMPATIGGVSKRIVGSASRNKWINKWCFVDQMAVEKKYGPKKEQTKTIWVNIPKGCKDPVGLNQALCSTGYIRIEREEVLDMPDKLIVSHSIPMEKSGKKEYLQILNDFEKWVIENGGDPERIAGSEKLVQLGKLVEYAALAKVKFAAEYIAALVEQQEQVVVMGHHKSVIAELREVLSDAGITSVTFTGSDNPAQKAENIEKFKSGKVQVLLGNIQSAGTGLNLENAANLVFVQLPWSPAEFEQASDRIYRVTQTRNCTIHTLPALDSVEEHVVAVLDKKRVITEGINSGNGSADDGESVANEVFEMMM